ncbi:MAG: FMN-binding protein, partial [Clostridia bacterium]|nr:FMN-binding protein [Clostridia bacterium]
LGSNIKNDSFKDQFKKKISANGFNIVKNSTNQDNEIQAITGATISSKAVTSCVNEAIEIFRKINRKW